MSGKAANAGGLTPANGNNAVRRKTGAKTSQFLSGLIFLSARAAAARVRHIKIDQNRILADQLDIAPADDDVLSSA